MTGLTHFDAGGGAHMVDVSDKDITARVAVATGFVRMRRATFWVSRALRGLWGPKRLRI